MKPIRQAAVWLSLCLLSGAIPSLVAAAEEEAAATASSTQKTYRLGIDDQVSIWVQDAAEFQGKQFRVDGLGEMNLPFIGRLRVAGMTLQQAEAAMSQLLEKYFHEPEIILSVSDYRSQPVSVIGAVKNPGIYQLQGRKTLVEMLSMAGGVRSDAGHVIKITRRMAYGPLPLPTASVDTEAGYSVGEVRLKTIVEARDPVENILVSPEDVISVPAAKMVYVIGDVEKQGGIMLNERETISVLEAVAMAGGAMRMAAPHNAKILRPLLGGPKRAELDIDVASIMSGRASDVPLLPDDILYIPGSATKRTAGRMLEALIQVGTWAGAMSLGR
jgi:polysaccharide export outer membrane protein